jgi:hypothetical protein
MMNEQVRQSLAKLDCWVENANWKAYDTFDGLSSPFARWFTFGSPLLRQVWQQAVRRCPVNVRPILGIKPSMSTKAMGFFAQGYLRLYQSRGDLEFLAKAKFCFQWLTDNTCKQFKGNCWGNHFDYQSRGGQILKGTPTIVWTGLIGHAFLDAYEILGEEEYLNHALSTCDFILDELGWIEFPEGILLRYYPHASIVVHNSSMIGASLLARASRFRDNSRYRDFAERTVQFTLHHQTPDGTWFYGVGKQWKWIDSFHSAYVLESLDTYVRSNTSEQFVCALKKGYSHFVETFFLSDGTPRYYAGKTRPLDIQCASQAIQTLVNLRRLHPRSIETAERVVKWTIENMQDKTGYFYYRKYRLITNKTPTLHWGQATMFAALALFDCYLCGESKISKGESSLKHKVRAA